MIKAVFFDLWNTLVTGGVNEETLMRANKYAWEYLKSKGYSISFEDYRKKRAECFLKYEELVRTKKLHLTPDVAFKEFVFKNINITAEDLKKVIYFHEMYDFYWEFRKDCADVLQKLKGAGFKIALVTDSWIRQSIYFLKKENLYDYFDAILISCDLGFGKPDKRIFELAAEKLGTKLSECAHIGDKHIEDIHGAYRAGVACAIAIEPFIREDNLRPPLAIVQNLSEILPILNKFNSVLKFHPSK